jgi:hypothetical protein
MPGSCDHGHCGQAAEPVIGDPQAIGGSREEASDQPGGDTYVYALTDEPAYLQTDHDEKPAIIAEPPPDLAQFKC